jgi:hypothetical protein
VKDFTYKDHLKVNMPITCTAILVSCSVFLQCCQCSCAYTGIFTDVELACITAEEDAQLIPTGMSNDCIAQSWFRFLHCLGNPANLCRPAMVSQTQKFLQFAITSENVIDPCQHPCLAALPLIFLKAIKGIAGQVDAFLGKVQLFIKLYLPLNFML